LPCSRLIAALLLGWAVNTPAQELATNVRIGLNGQAIFVSADFPPPFGQLVVRMAEKAGRLTALHFTSELGTVVAPTAVLDGLVASTHVELTWYRGAEDKVHASIQLPCKGWSDKTPDAQSCKKAFILVDGKLKRVIAYTPQDGGISIAYTEIP
jgi:hypothetical protein